MSAHGLTPWEPDTSAQSHVACVLFAGYDEAAQREDLVYIAVNAHWEAAHLTLPALPERYQWHIAVNTGDARQQTFPEGSMPLAGEHLLLGERSVIVLTGN